MMVEIGPTPLRASPPQVGVERFMEAYIMDCPGALNRLFVSGIPANLEHKSVSSDSGKWQSQLLIECVQQYYTTAMDLLSKLNRPGGGGPGRSPLLSSSHVLDFSADFYVDWIRWEWLSRPSNCCLIWIRHVHVYQLNQKRRKEGFGDGLYRGIHETSTGENSSIFGCTVGFDSISIAFWIL